MGIEKAQLQICGHFPSKTCRSPQRQCSIFCFSCQLPRSSAVSLPTCHKVPDHQPLFHPDPSFVGLSSCVFSNVASFRVYPRSRLNVEVSRDVSDVFSCVALVLYVFVHLFDVHVRVSLVGEVHTGHFGLALTALDVVVIIRSLTFFVCMIFGFHFLFKSVPTLCF